MNTLNVERYMLIKPSSNFIAYIIIKRKRSKFYTLQTVDSRDKLGVKTAISGRRTLIDTERRRRVYTPCTRPFVPVTMSAFTFGWEILEISAYVRIFLTTMEERSFKLKV